MFVALKPNIAHCPLEWLSDQCADLFFVAAATVELRPAFMVFEK
jgi:hypothetical protein